MASNNKYDRQLRLWGAAGQESLALSHVVLLGCSGTVGCETVKNLVLPGIGGFTCIDTATYPLPQTGDDPLVPSSNFFIPPSTPTTPETTLASVVSSTLQELNPDVSSSFLVPDVSISEFISNSVPSASTPKTSLTAYLTSTDNVPFPPPENPSESGARGTVLLVGCDLRETDTRALSETADKLKLPLLLVRTYGMIGTLRIQSSRSSFTVIEPRSEGVKWDLRMRETVEDPTTFPELAEFVKGMVDGMPDMDQQQHGHVPYVAILMDALSNWMSSHYGSAPSTFAEKDQFRAAVKGMSKDWNMEVNFQEGVREAYTAYTECKGVPEHVRELMEREEVKNIHRDSTSFSILLDALDEFTSKHGGMPPLNGSIPDMTSDSENYIKLQGIYFDRAKRELREFQDLVGDRLNKLSLPPTLIPLPTILTFTKNVPYLTVVPSKSYHTERTTPPTEEDKEQMQGASWDPHEEQVHTPMLWWAGVKAAEIYQEKHGNWPRPGDEGTNVEIEGLIVDVLTSYGLTLSSGTLFSNETVSSVASEITRYEGAENHCVGSVVGGVAGQEGVKVITGIYTPIDNTYVFNGIAGVGGVVKA